MHSTAHTHTHPVSNHYIFESWPFCSLSLFISIHSVSIEYVLFIRFMSYFSRTFLSAEILNLYGLTASILDQSFSAFFYDVCGTVVVLIVAMILNSNFFRYVVLFLFSSSLTCFCLSLERIKFDGKKFLCLFKTCFDIHTYDEARSTRI